VIANKPNLKCKKCERTFKSQGALNGHQRSHSFFRFIRTLRSTEEREEERKDAEKSIVIAAIKHFSHNYHKTGEKPHCDMCVVIKEKIDRPLIQDLLAWFDSEKKE